MRLLSLLRSMLRSFVGGLRWLARQTYRQRSLGVAQSPQLARLLDLHALTIAAHVALIAALIVVPARIEPLLWLVAAVATAALTSFAVWLSGRLIIGLLIAAQGIGAVLAAQWLSGPAVPFLLALAVAQQVTLIVVWFRHGAPPSALSRATAYGLLVGIFTGGGGLVAGWFAPAAPLWIAAVLLTGAALLTLKMPDPPRPIAVPKQGRTAVPEGYAVYRPSSLDSPGPP